MITVGGFLANSIRRVWPPRTRDELVVDDLDDLLGRVQRAADLGPERPLAHRGGELADHRQRDVGVEQGDPDLADRRSDVGLGQPALAAQVLEGGGQAVGEGGEHGSKPIVARDSAPVAHASIEHRTRALRHPGRRQARGRRTRPGRTCRPPDPRAWRRALTDVDPGPGERRADRVQQPGPVRRPHLDHRRVARTRPAPAWPGSGRASPRRRGRSPSGGRPAPLQGLQRRAVAVGQPAQPAGEGGGVRRVAVRRRRPTRCRPRPRRRCAGARTAPTRPRAASSPAVSANRPSRSRATTVTACMPSRRCGRPRAARPAATLAMTSRVTSSGVSRGGASGRWWSVSWNGPARRGRRPAGPARRSRPAGPAALASASVSARSRSSRSLRPSTRSTTTPRRSAGRRGRGGWPGRPG